MPTDFDELFKDVEVFSMIWAFNPLSWSLQLLEGGDAALPFFQKRES